MSQKCLLRAVTTDSSIYVIEESPSPTLRGTNTLSVRKHWERKETGVDLKSRVFYEEEETIICSCRNTSRTRSQIQQSELSREKLEGQYNVTMMAFSLLVSHFKHEINRSEGTCHPV